LRINSRGAYLYSERKREGDSLHNDGTWQQNFRDEDPMGWDAMGFRTRGGDEKFIKQNID
jgi:hypothetical protein